MDLIMDTFNSVLDWFKGLSLLDVIGLIGAAASIFGGAFYGNKKLKGKHHKHAKKVTKTTTTRVKRDD